MQLFLFIVIKYANILILLMPEKKKKKKNSLKNEIRETKLFSMYVEPRVLIRVTQTLE
jgi:hypothetical protein